MFATAVAWLLRIRMAARRFSLRPAADPSGCSARPLISSFEHTMTSKSPSTIGCRRPTIRQPGWTDERVVEGPEADDDYSGTHPRSDRFQRNLRSGGELRVALARAFNATLHLLHVEPRRDLQIIVERELVVEKYLSEPTAATSPQNAARELLGKILTEQEEKELRAEYVLRASGLGGPYVESSATPRNAPST